MLARIVAGLIAVGMAPALPPIPVPGSSPSQAPSPAPSASPLPALIQTVAPIPEGQPVREVTYKVVTSLRIDDISESFGGGSGAVPPASTEHGANHGTVIVDVMGKSKDGVLYIVFREQWEQHLRPERIKVSLSPNGVVALANGVFEDVAIELLPFFAIRFLPDGQIDLTTQWQTAVDGTPIHYAVTAIDGPILTIHKTASIQGLHSEDIDGSVEYDIAQLAPTVGKLTRRGLEMYGNGQTQATLTITFERVSDSFVKR